MPRFFNTSGPNNPEDHYTVPVLSRLPGLRKLIDQKLYFGVSGPQQVGKSTALRALAHELTAEGRHAAVLLPMEQGAPFSDHPGAAELAILNSWRHTANPWLPSELQPPAWPDAPAGARIGAALSTWAVASSRPLVVFLDNIDALHDEALTSVLAQIRAGFATRPRHFPSSLALIGIGRRTRTSVPFNIQAESLTLHDFTHDEAAQLYGQHTEEAGQVFEPEAVKHAYHLTQGQPWLLNALARQLTEVLVPDTYQAITPADVEQARELLIRRQDTHLDSPVDRLRELGGREADVHGEVRNPVAGILDGSAPEHRDQK